jgi:Methyltransferase domain
MGSVAFMPSTRTPPTEWNDVNSVDTYDSMLRSLIDFRLTDVVTVLRQYSHEALVNVPKPIDLLFIDGDHSYEGVKADWDNYTPHMSRFGHSSIP